MMENYLLQGNVIKLLPLEFPKDEHITESTWRAVNHTTAILKSGVTSGCSYDEFLVNIENSIKNENLSILEHRLSPYVDGVMFANENVSSHKDFMAFNSFCYTLPDILKDDECFLKFIECAGKKFNAKNRLREVNVRTVPETDGGYTEFLDVKLMASELSELRTFIAGNYQINNLLCAIITSVFLMHTHPLYDGNGRASRVLFNFILGRDRRNYIALTELCHVARSGYVLSLREAFLFSEWNPIIVFYCKCIEIIHSGNTK